MTGYFGPIRYYWHNDDPESSGVSEYPPPGGDAEPIGGWWRPVGAAGLINEPTPQAVAQSSAPATQLVPASQVQTPVVQAPASQAQAASVGQQPAGQQVQIGQVLPRGKPLGQYARTTKIKLQQLVRRGYVHVGDVWVYTHIVGGQGQVSDRATVSATEGGRLWASSGAVAGGVPFEVHSPTGFALQFLAFGEVAGNVWGDIEVIRAGLPLCTLDELRTDAYAAEP